MLLAAARLPQVYGDPAVALAMAKVMGFAAGCSPQPQAERRDGAPGGGSAAAAEAPGQQRRYMVWGSSAGWLVLYGAAAKGWRLCTGVELLPCLVQEARTAAARLGYEGEPYEAGWPGAPRVCDVQQPRLVPTLAASPGVHPPANSPCHAPCTCHAASWRAPPQACRLSAATCWRLPSGTWACCRPRSSAGTRSSSARWGGQWAGCRG